ncbi:flippase [Cytobacillus oceanisediminis]|uniref:flippase n=1 Tax=Cytobacillus oceanisediminis TaxID=665099 RepID=UPI001C237CCF|nr:flippase [Cytobacillus oceanisediminis]MBU8771497.1 flippase [Cytobacillus oceanisediminis]
MSNSFIKNTVMTLTRQISGILLGLLASIIIARSLGPEGNGLYQLIVLLPTTLMTLLNFGVGTSSVYYVGQNKYEIKDIIKTNTASGIVLSLVSIIIGFVTVMFFSDKFFEGVPQDYLYIILMIMPLLMLNEFYLVIFQGVQDFKSYNSLALLRQLAALLSLVLFIFLLQIGLVGTVIAFTVGVITQFTVTLFLFKKSLKTNLLAGKISRDYFKDSFSFGFKAHFSNVLSFINYRADIYLISMFLNPAAVGLYGVAVSIAERLWIVSQSISSVLYPVISSSNDIESKNKLTSIISRNVLFFSILAGIVFYFVSDLIFRILFGAAYDESSDILKMLLPGIILFSVDRILSNDLAGRGKPELNMYTSIFTVVSNIILNFVLIPKIGIAGAAVSTSVTYSLSTIIKIVLYKRETGVAYSKLVLLQKEDMVLFKQLINKAVKRK